jgi:hypothetical protein
VHKLRPEVHSRSIIILGSNAMSESWANPMPNPLLLADPDASIREFIRGTVAVLPHPLVATDEDLAVRLIARQLGGQDRLLPYFETNATDLWKYISRG